MRFKSEAGVGGFVKGRKHTARALWFEENPREVLGTLVLDSDFDGFFLDAKGFFSFFFFGVELPRHCG